MKEERKSVNNYNWSGLLMKFSKLLHATYKISHLTNI